MAKYTWDDIIINPNSEQAKACIGKKVYCANNPTELLIRANKNNIFALDELLKIYPKSREPFKVDDIFSSSSYTCIILKKEKSQKDKPKEYVPFDNIKELVEASLDHNKNHYLSKVGGLWLKHKKDGLICLITSTINDNKVYYLFFENEPYGLDDIFDHFCFLDGTPCGKLKE